MKTIFAVVGSLAALLAISTVAMSAVFYTPGASARAMLGSLLYVGISIACLYGFLRTKGATNMAKQRGFDVVVPEPGDADGR